MIHQWPIQACWVTGLVFGMGWLGCDSSSLTTAFSPCDPGGENPHLGDVEPSQKGQSCHGIFQANVVPAKPERAPPLDPETLSYTPTLAALDGPLLLSVQGKNLRSDSMVRIGGQEVRLTANGDGSDRFSATLWPPFAHQDFSAAVEVKNPGESYQQSKDRLSFFVSSPTYRYAYPSTGGPPQFAMGLGDFTGDGVVDIVRADSQYPCKVRVYKLSGRYPEDSQAWLTGFSITDITYKNPDPSDQPSFSALASGDFDSDGDLDLALSQFHGGQIRLMWNDGNGYFPQSQKLNVGERLVAIAAADLNEDGHPDLATLDENSGQLAVLLWTGPKRFAAPRYFSTKGLFPEALQLVDMNHDGHLDAVVANQGSNTVAVLDGTGWGDFAAAKLTPSCPGPISVAVGDLNDDQRLDVATGCPSSGEVGLLFASSDSPGFQPFESIQVGRLPFGIAVADLNHDQRTDIVVGHLEGGHASLLFQEREGRPGRFKTPRLEPERVIEDWMPAIVATHDLNHDGLPDVLIGKLRYGGTSIALSKLLTIR